jgi:hypothetical protein
MSNIILNVTPLPDAAIRGKGQKRSPPFRLYAMITEYYLFCPSTLTQETPMNCPVCNNTLTQVTIENIRLDICFVSSRRAIIFQSSINNGRKERILPPPVRSVAVPTAEETTNYSHFLHKNINIDELALFFSVPNAANNKSSIRKWLPFSR